MDPQIFWTLFDMLKREGTYDLPDGLLGRTSYKLNLHISI